MTSETGAKTFQIVVAASARWGIGNGGALPWKIPGDTKRFAEITTRTFDAEKTNAVVMGRKTWESLPRKFRPLPERLNVVLSRTADALDFPPGVLVARSLDGALALLSEIVSVETVFVIGGGEVYAEALASPALDAVHLTRVETEAECDAFFPPLGEDRFRVVNSSPTYESAGTRYSFLTYVTRPGFDPTDVASNPLKKALNRLSSNFYSFFVNFC
jgi:dihydrofolate reductase/thymidylate synthase